MFDNQTLRASKGVLLQQINLKDQQLKEYQKTIRELKKTINLQKEIISMAEKQRSQYQEQIRLKETASRNLKWEIHHMIQDSFDLSTNGMFEFLEILKYIKLLR